MTVPQSHSGDDSPDRPRASATYRIIPDGGRRRPVLGGAFLPLVALGMTCGLAFRGFDSAAGQALSCLVNAATLITALLIDPPPFVFWRDLRGVLALAAAALAWAALGLVVPTYALDGQPVPFAPDLFAPAAAAYLAGVAALVIGALIGREARARERVVDWLIALGVATLLLGLLLIPVGTMGVFSDWMVQIDGRFAGLIGNANVTATVAGVLLVLTLVRLAAPDRLAMATSRKGLIRLAPYGLALVVTAATVALAASRAAGAVTLVVVLLLVLVTYPPSRMERVAPPPPLLIAVLAVVAILLVGGGLLGQRMQSSGFEAANRMNMWSHFLAIAGNSPFFGYGLGSFAGVNAHFLPDAHFAAPFWNVNSPHGIMLQMLLGGGAPYLLLVLGAVALLLRRVGPDVLRRPSIEGRGLVAAAIVLVACGCVDIVLDMAGTTTLLLFLAGLSLGRATGEE